MSIEWAEIDVMGDTLFSSIAYILDCVEVSLWKGCCLPPGSYTVYTSRPCRVALQERVTNETSSLSGTHIPCRYCEIRILATSSLIRRYCN